MKKSILALAALLLATPPWPSQAQILPLDFDQNFGVRPLLDQVRRSAGEARGAVKKAQVGDNRYEQDCAVFTFEPNDPPVSERFRLMSREWEQRCQPGPNGTWQCWEVPGFLYSEIARISLQDRRPLLPWESDSFRVCLEGPWLSIYQLESGYDYKLVRGGPDFALAPVKKIPMGPDPNGIAVESLSGSLQLGLQDKWASYYQGEKIFLKLVVKKEVNFPWDPTVAVIDATMTVALDYKVNLLDYADKFDGKPVPGSKYYVQVSFKRLGAVSTDEQVKAGDSAHVPYQPAR
ncbi:MAG: hypothetical protein HY921_08030 [Elusimicrobia bacterium]|nr:hypothetical protein [Elusimicrobiota bacterium]